MNHTTASKTSATHLFTTFAVALLLGGLLRPADADAGMTLSGKPKISFFAVGSPSFLNIEGVSSTMTLTDTGTQLQFAVPMSTVDTGVSLRNDHMNNEYIHVEQFPNATLTLNKADVPWPAEVGKSAKGTAKGTFEVHGIATPTDITYEVAKTKTGYRVKAKFNYDTTQHGITIESYMGVTIDPKMYATVTLDLVDAP